MSRDDFNGQERRDSGETTSKQTRIFGGHSFKVTLSKNAGRVPKPSKSK